MVGVRMDLLQSLYGGSGKNAFAAAGVACSNSVLRNSPNACKLTTNPENIRAECLRLQGGFMMLTEPRFELASVW